MLSHPQRFNAQAGSVQEGNYGESLLTTADQSRFRGLDWGRTTLARKLVDPIASSLNLMARAQGRSLYRKLGSRALAHTPSASCTGPTRDVWDTGCDGQA